MTRSTRRDTSSFGAATSARPPRSRRSTRRAGHTPAPGHRRQPRASPRRRHHSGRMIDPTRVAALRETPTDWDKQWRGEPQDLAAPAAEARTPRWARAGDARRRALRLVRAVRAIELGAGRGLKRLSLRRARVGRHAARQRPARTRAGAHAVRRARPLVHRRGRRPLRAPGRAAGRVRRVDVVRALRALPRRAAPRGRARAPRRAAPRRARVDRRPQPARRRVPRVVEEGAHRDGLVAARHGGAVHGRRAGDARAQRRRRAARAAVRQLHRVRRQPRREPGALQARAQGTASCRSCPFRGSTGWRTSCCCPSSSPREGRGPHDVVPAGRARRRGIVSSPTRCATCARATSTSRSFRRRRSAITGSNGSGIVGNVRARPTRALALPLFLAAFGRAAARARRATADLVHAQLARRGRRRGDARHAVRRPGLGDGRRARAPARRGCAPDPPPGGAGDRRVERARPTTPGRSGARRGARDPERRRLARGRSRARRPAARALRRTALRGEGHPRAARGRARAAARRRRRRALRDRVPGALGFVRTTSCSGSPAAPPSSPPLAPGGLRRRLRRGDGPRPPRGRERRRRPPRPRGGRRDGPPRAARRRDGAGSRPRAPAGRRGAPASARRGRPARARSSVCRGAPRPTRRSRPTRRRSAARRDCRARGRPSSS